MARRARAAEGVEVGHALRQVARQLAECRPVEIERKDTDAAPKFAAGPSGLAVQRLDDCGYCPVQETGWIEVTL